MLIDDLSKIPDEFKCGVRGIMLILRNKDGFIGNSQRKCFKKISRNIDEWNQIVCEFQSMKINGYGNYRIYSSVNSRNMKKAIHDFKIRSLSADYGFQEELDWFYKDIENRFFSCLMNPNARTSSYFLIDCDSDEEHLKATTTIPKHLILFEYKTKNGNHIICNPFNPEDFGIIIKKDAMIYIG